MDKNTYSISTYRKPPKPRSTDRQATSTGAAPTAAAYDPTITPSHVASANHAATADSATSATNANHARTADTATSATTAQHAEKSATAEALQTANFNAGASGARVADDGSAEVETLTVRGFIKAAEYLINRIKITEGAQWLTEGGVIERVETATPQNGAQGGFALTMRERFAGDTQAPFVVGDILRGQYNNLQGGGGVQTSWMRVQKVEGRVVTVGLYQNGQVPGGANAQPIVQMRVARWGNASDTTRQSHIVLDPERGQIVRRMNVNAPIIDHPEQVDGFSLGTLPTWVQNALGGAVNENSNYLYARGIITQDIIRFSPQGQPIAERVDRGVWSAEQSYYHEGKNATTGIYEISRVWLDGALYELAPRGDGSTQPSANNPNWIVVQEKPQFLSPRPNELPYTRWSSPAINDLKYQMNAVGDKLTATVRITVTKGTQINTYIFAGKEYEGKPLVWSFYVRNTTTHNIRLGEYYNCRREDGKPLNTPINPNEVVRCYYAYKNGAKYLHAYTVEDVAVGDTVEFFQPKLEFIPEGEKMMPTAYLPCLQDLMGQKGDPGEPGRSGADGLTPMPNLLRNADLPAGRSAWIPDTTGHPANVQFESNEASPIAGAQVWSAAPQSAYFDSSKPSSSTNPNSYAQIRQELQFVKGRTYTFSVYVKGATTGWLILWRNAGSQFHLHLKSTAAEVVGEWKRYSYTYSPTESGSHQVILRAWNQGSIGRVYFAAPKVEESFQPTPWTRAQEDFRGAAVRPLGDWDALPDGFKFQSGEVGEEFIDLVSVKSEGAILWWSCKRSHAKTKDTRPSVNAPFWELGQNLKFVATDLLLAKEAVIEGNILASSMSYKAEEDEGVIKGALIFQDGKTHILPKLREGEVREIRVMPLPRFHGENDIVTRINMPDDDNGYITYNTYKKRGNGRIPSQTSARKYRVLSETKYLIFLGQGKTRSTDWVLFDMSVREEEYRTPEGFEGIVEEPW